MPITVSTTIMVYFKQTKKGCVNVIPFWKKIGDGNPYKSGYCGIALSNRILLK